MTSQGLLTTAAAQASCGGSEHTIAPASVFKKPPVNVILVLSILRRLHFA